MRHRLVRAREIPVLEPFSARLRELEAPPRVPERGLGSAEGRVDARALPLAAGAVRRRAHLAPDVARHVCCMDHLVEVGLRANRELEELPHPVEGRDRELAPIPRVHLDRYRGQAGEGHRDLFLRVLVVLE